MGDELVRVERFEELATGTRVRVLVCTWCESSHHDYLLLSYGKWFHGPMVTAAGDVDSSSRSFCLSRCCNKMPNPVLTDAVVAQGRVFRFAVDLGIPGAIAAEQNPYTARTVVGTGGREETRTLARERGR